MVKRYIPIIFSILFIICLMILMYGLLHPKKITLGNIMLVLPSNVHIISFKNEKKQEYNFFSIIGTNPTCKLTSSFDDCSFIISNLSKKQTTSFSVKKADFNFFKKYIDYSAQKKKFKMVKNEIKCSIYIHKSDKIENHIIYMKKDNMLVSLMGPMNNIYIKQFCS